MDCQQFRDALDCYVDRELSVEAAAAVDAHRGECPSCNRAAVRLLDVKAAVKRTVGATAVPLYLEGRVREAVTPRWPDRLRRRPARVAIAAAAVVFVAAALTVGTRTPIATTAANAMERLALLLDEGSPVAIDGTLLCRDCELEHRYGVKATCDVIGHHGAIAAAGGRIWNIVEQSSSASLIHDDRLLGRQILVRGRIFRGAGALVVESYELHGSATVARLNSGPPAGE